MTELESAFKSLSLRKSQGTRTAVSGSLQGRTKRSSQLLITQYSINRMRNKKRQKKEYDPLFDIFSTDIPDYINVHPEMVYYVYPSVQLIYKKRTDEYRVYAKSDITAGSILAIEEGRFDTRDNLLYYLEEHPHFAKELYPRSRFGLRPIQDKLNYNLWEWSEDIFALFMFLSKFNHSCTPNCALSREILDDHPDHFRAVFVLIATKDIKQTDEICLSYGSHAGHGDSMFNWVCTCWKDKEERETLFEKSVEYANEAWNKQRESFMEKIRKIRKIR